MSAPLLTTVARCLDTRCGWAAEGDAKAVDAAGSRHVKTEGHGVTTTTRNPEAPERRPS